MASHMCFKMEVAHIPRPVPPTGNRQPGLLRIHVQRGVNLAVRDMRKRSSDPYIVIQMGKQKLRTRVIHNNVNPVWNEDLTLSISEPTLPIKLFVYDHDTFTFDDKMGDADFHIDPFLDAVKMYPDRLPSGTIITKIQADQQNCLAKESCIIWNNGKVVQDMVLRLRNVESGAVELQLEWIHVPRSTGL